MISDLVLRLLAEASLRGALVLALAALAAVCARRRSAELRHAIWSAGLVAALAMPLGPFLLPRWSLPILPARQTPTAVVRIAPPERASAAIGGRIEPVATLESQRPVGALLVGLWLAGALVLLVPELRARRRLAALRRASKPALEAALARAFRDAMRATGVAFPVDGRISHDLRVPIACGIERPAVLLPADAIGWSPEVLRDVLVHELSHLRRRDPSWLTVAALARAIYWFHPLVWIATLRMRAESERACDDAVMRGGERPSRYAETLLFVAGADRGAEPRAALAFVRPRGLERRIGELLTRGRNWSALGPRGWTLVAACAVLLGAGVAVTRPVAAVSKQTPPPAPTPHAEESWRPLEAARSFAAETCNEEKGPVRVQDAAVELTKGTNDRTRVARPVLKLVNFDRRRAVTAVRLAFELPTTRDQTWKLVGIEPRRSAEIRLSPSEWSAIVPSEDAERLIVQVSGVRFANGASWEGKDTITFPPAAKDRAEGAAPETPAPEAAKPSARVVRVTRSFPDEPSVAARFRNPEDAPVVIRGARTPTRTGAAGMTYLPAVMLENRSDREVVALRLRYKADVESHAVSGYDVAIEPHDTVVLQRRGFDVWGSPEDMTVQVLGARFADGSIWGTMDSRIDGRDRWVYPLEEDGAR